MPPRIIAPLLVAALCLGCQTTPTTMHSPAVEIPASGDWLYLWSADRDRAHEDFLAVVDIRKGSQTYATVVASVPVGKRGTFPHHTEHELAGDSRLYANGFGSGDTFVFDLTTPGAPSLATRIEPPAPYRKPHSYARLPDGNVLATLQSSGDKSEEPGGLMEIAADGTIVRTSSAADGAVDDHFLPYSLSVVEQLGVVVTTSSDMHERWVSRVVQVWRLPDLELVRTLQLPPGPGGKEGWDPAEPRVLSDGQTVMVSTFNCGLYLMEGLESDAPSARFVHAFEGGGCALPVVVGDYWIQTVPDAHAIVVLDVRAPEHPREVSRIELGPEFSPHWISAAPDGRRLVLTGYGPRVLLLDFDRDNGRIAIDPDFRDAGAEVPGLDFGRTHWPHGESGPADPHGAVFQ